MAGRRPTRNAPTTFAQTPGVDDPKVQRAFDVVSRAIHELQSKLGASVDVFTATADGLAPASGGSASDYLAADGVWKTIVGAGAVDSVTAGSTMVTASPTVGAVIVNVVPGNFTGIPQAGVVFSGTNNTVAKFSGTALVDSSITDTGSLVTVTNPLTVTGATTLSLMTAGSVLFAGASGLVSQDNANFFWDDTNNRLGLGTVAPSKALHVVGDVAVTGTLPMITVGATGKTKTNFVPGIEITRDANVDLVISSYGTGTSAQILLARGRGTAAAQTAIQSGDQMGQLAFTGVGGSGGGEFFSSCLIRGVAAQNFNTTTDFGGQMEFYTTANGAGSGGRAVRLTISDAGIATFTNNVIITSTTNTQLLVGTAAATKSGLAATSEFTRDAASATMVLSTYGTAVNPQFYMLRGRGTAAASAAVLSGDSIGTITFAGLVSATGTLASAFVGATATENWGAGIGGSRLAFTTCLNTTTTRTAKLGVENDGGITLTNSATAAVSAASELRLRYNTTTTHRLQYSANAGAYVDVVTQAAAGGTANTIPKWSNTTGTLAASLLTDDAATLSYNAGKFTVTAASGNTTVAGTLGVTGLATLTAGFTAGAASSMGSFKITSLANGAAASDAAAFGQIATAVSAAVSGSTNQIAKFTSANAVGNSSIADSGSMVTILSDATISGVAGTSDPDTGNNLIIADTTSTGLGVGGAILFQGLYDVGSNAGGGGIKLHKTNATAGNFSFDLAFYTRANLGSVAEAMRLRDDKSALFAGAVTVTGALAVNGNCTLGDATTDVHTINGLTTINTPATGPGLDVRGAYDNTAANVTQLRVSESASYRGSIGYDEAGGTTFVLDNSFNDPTSVISLRIGNTERLKILGSGVVSADTFLASTNISSLGTLAVNGNCTLGDATSDSHTINGTLVQSNTYTARATDCIGHNATLAGTYDATASNRGVTTFAANAMGTRSAGANSVVNIAGDFHASGGQVNLAIRTYGGDNWFNQSSGSSTFYGAVSVTGAATFASTVDVASTLYVDYITNHTALAGVYIEPVAGKDVTMNADRVLVGDSAAGSPQDGDLYIQGAIHNVREFLAPQITANQNDWNPTQASPSVQWDASHSSILYISSDAARDITGLTNPGGGTGRHVWIYNTGAFSITLKHQSASSSAGNKFYGTNNADVVLTPRTGRHLYLSAQMADWIVLA